MPATLVPAYGAGTLDQQQAQAQAQQNLPWYQRVINALFGSGLSQQVQSLVNPLEAAAVLPREVLQTAKALGVPAKQIMDWSQARPGIYVGFRAHVPGNVESLQYYGGTYSTRNLPFAQEIAQKSFDKRVLSQVGIVTRNPLHINVPEHKALLLRVAKDVEKNTKPYLRQPIVHFRQDVEHGIIPQNIPDAIYERLRALGYDAIISSAEAEGAYPTIVSLETGRTQPIRSVTPRYTQPQLAAYYLRQYPSRNQPIIPTNILPLLAQAYQLRYGSLPEPSERILDEIPLIRNRLIDLFQKRFARAK